MKRLISAFVLLTLCAVGCGDDSDDNSNGDENKGGSSAGTDGGQAGEPQTGGGMAGSEAGGASNGNVACDPKGATVCQNAKDCPFVEDGTARMTAGVCGQGCLGKAETCAVDCILKDLDMSSECASCYAQIVACTVKECLSECLADPEAKKCSDCQETSGCRAAFNECSGLPE